MTDTASTAAATSTATETPRMVVVTYYAAAADAAGVDSERVHTAASTVGELGAELADRHGEPLASIVAASRFLVGDDMVRDPGTPLADHPRVDVLPPFAGG